MRKAPNPPPPEEKYRPVPKVDPPRPWPGPPAVNLKPKGETKMGEKIQLGAKVKDSITGFVGTVTARCEYQFADPHVLVEAVDTTGRPIEHWLKESRAEVQG